jgi:hypothetical protein
MIVHHYDAKLSDKDEEMKRLLAGHEIDLVFRRPSALRGSSRIFESAKEFRRRKNGFFASPCARVPFLSFRIGAFRFAGNSIAFASALASAQGIAKRGLLFDSDTAPAFP